MNVSNYEAYVEEWLKGIDFEIKFWDKLMETEGSCGGDPEVYKLRISPETRFSLEDEIETDETAFCDVGSGPFSNCGVYTYKTNLKITADDPLAKVYEVLKSKYGVVSPINPITGMVELLGRQFEENCFDIVHMSNSLDHCFDPVEGIKQMLAICKVGGKIILRHNENEAEHAKYQGFHQWNIHVENDKFYIWRKDIKIDVAEEIKEFAQVEKAEMAEKAGDGSRWVHNKVVIRKTNEIKVENNAYMNVLITKFLEEICILNMQKTKE